MTVADMLFDCVASVNSNCRGTQGSTQLRNTERALELCSFLFRRGFICGYRILHKSTIELDYKYNQNRCAFYRLAMISRPGNRIYYSYNKLRKHCAGPRANALFILSTSSGLLLSGEALTKHIGGELIARIVE
jgi:ribosomal protein S8